MYEKIDGLVKSPIYFVAGLLRPQNIKHPP